MRNAKCIKYQLWTFIVWTADLRPAIFQWRYSILPLPADLKACLYSSRCFRQVQASFAAVAIQTVASVLCTPLGVQAPVAQRQSTWDSARRRCAVKKE